MRKLRMICVAVVLAAAGIASLSSVVLAQWPTTCVELNDIVETHLGNDHNVGIYQRVFGEQAEAACQNDHRDDVRGVFAWAFDEADLATQTVLPDLAWPTDCVELNDIVEAHLGNDHNVEIYQRVFGDQAEPACRNDHRDDVRGVFAWAFNEADMATPTLEPTVPPTPTAPPELAPGRPDTLELGISTIQGQVVAPTHLASKGIFLFAWDISINDIVGGAKIGEDRSFVISAPDGSFILPDGSFVLAVLAENPWGDSYSLVGWYGPGGFTTTYRDATRIKIDGESVSDIIIRLPDALVFLTCIVDNCAVQNDDLLWLIDTGQTSALAFSPTIVQGRLYAASSVGEVYALNAQSGELLWSIDLDTDLDTNVWAPPVAAGSTVYIEQPSGDYYALDAATGEHLLLNIEETGRIRGVELRDGAVHVTAVLPDGGIVVRSYDPQTGQLLRESRPQVPEIDYDQFKVTVLGDTTYIRDGRVIHAFDSPAGNFLWSFDAGVITPGVPAASDGVVYTRSGFAVHALDETTGDVVWKFDGPYGDWTEHPTYIVDGVWVVLLRYGALHGLDVATGQPLWSHPDGYAVFVSGAANGTVFVVGSDEFRALDAATGDEIWSRGVGSDWEVQQVTVADGVLYSTYSTSHFAWLQVLDARTGKPIWNSYDVNRPLGADPYLADPYLVMDGLLYLAIQGTIFALEAPQRR